MVFIKVTPKIQELLNYYKEKGYKPEISSELRLGEYIDYEYIKILITILNKNNYPETLYYYDLVKPDQIAYTIEIQRREVLLEEEKDTKHQEYIQRLKIKKQEQDYQKLVKNITGKTSKTGFLSQEPVKDIGQSVSMGLSFIVSLFGGALTGYFLGKYYYLAPEQDCLIMGVQFLIFTLILESGLYILKTMKDDKIKRMRREKAK